VILPEDATPKPDGIFGKDRSTIFDWDPAQAARSRRKFLTEIAGTGKYVLPIHFPHPTTGLIEADGARFRYKFVR